MHTWLRKLGVLFLLSASLSTIPLVAQEDTIRWLDNYQQAIEEARRTNRPIFLEFRCEA